MTRLRTRLFAIACRTHHCRNLRTRNLVLLDAGPGGLPVPAEYTGVGARGHPPGTGLRGNTICALRSSMMRMRSSFSKRQSSLTPTMRKRTSNSVCALKLPAITAGRRSCCSMLSQSTTPSCPVGVSPTSIFVATTCRHSGRGRAVRQKCRRTTRGLCSSCAGAYRPTPTRSREGFLNNNPELIRQYLDFLLAKNQLPAAAEIAQRLTQVGDPETDDPEMFSVIDRLIAAKEGDAAKALWNVLIEKHWVVADTGAPNNPNFARDPLPVSFDWELFSFPGLHSWPGPSGLETEFSGDAAGKLHHCRTGDCSSARQLRDWSTPTARTKFLRRRGSGGKSLPRIRKRFWRNLPIFQAQR